MLLTPNSPSSNLNSIPRRLKNLILKNLNVDVSREEQELVPGGDIRIRGNLWLRKAFSMSRIKRVPREGEFRKVVRIVAAKKHLCHSEHTTLNIRFCFELFSLF